MRSSVAWGWLRCMPGSGHSIHMLKILGGQAKDITQLCYWSTYFIIHRKESKIITQGSLVYACNYSFSFVTHGVLSFLVFSVYAGSGNVLTPRKVFSTLILLFFARLYFLQFVLYCLLHISEMSVAVKRIQVTNEI